MEIAIFRLMNIEPVSLFAALGHGTRLRCLLLLLSHEELCVCEMTYALGVVQPHISRHLAQLRELGLVVDRRAGLWIYYRVNPALPDWVFRVLWETVQGASHQEPFTSDRTALAAMPNRPGATHCA
ncbi:metalloregulator ArsR/SmtB family transcription factor [Nitrosococcus wardiae]|uniref:metalloregulator ArsR/SmtB family transcription factor n=1 Tax=Nitrosococcus wardiae TaxID=1814290 RepID=UPI001F0F5CA6|nr:metalloregulator ArsR/SmtB family transcription factor [Nitrosococcus wardiae]